MNVLILGSGGREHALAWKITQSPLLTKLFVAPGNAGTAGIAENVSINVAEFEKIKEFVLAHGIQLVVVGPEDPLVKGIADYFKKDEQLKNIGVIGPDRSGAQLEGSKEFAKQFMEKYKIPTAQYKSFRAADLEDGIAFLETMKPPYVLKADGLAAGKGVLILEDLDQAKKELSAMLQDHKFGAASDKVVIEEFLSGIELSVFVLTDGRSHVLLPTAKDYKRIGAGDTGLNTGGMGAISPVPFADETFMKKVQERIVDRTMTGLQAENMDYKGFIFIGLMAVEGEPYVIEYNVRMGDPETEVVMPRLKTDLLTLFQAVVQGTMEGQEISFDQRTAATVMMVSGGYPEAYEKNKVIQGLDNIRGSIVFHAGTKFEGDQYQTNGGRVLAVTSYGNNMQEALERSYVNAGKIEFEKCYYRKDIGFDLVNYS